jgi:hypothetical protein
MFAKNTNSTTLVPFTTTMSMGALTTGIQSTVLDPRVSGTQRMVIDDLIIGAAGVRTTIYRVGQIAGPTTQQGQWNPDEWLPAMEAIHLGSTVLVAS